MEVKESNVIKQMASLLKQGGAILHHSCPFCAVPLFRLKSGEIVCPSCNRRVYIAKDAEEEARMMDRLTIAMLGHTICNKLRELNDRIGMVNDYGELYELGKLLVVWLEALEKVRKLMD